MILFKPKYVSVHPENEVCLSYENKILGLSTQKMCALILKTKSLLSSSHAVPKASESILRFLAFGELTDTF